MFPRIGLMVLGGSLGLLPISPVPEELAVAKHVIGDLFRRPLRIVRAIRGQRPVKVLAIGSSSTAGVGASSPSATYVARLELTLEGALKGTDFDVVGSGRRARWRKAPPIA